MTKIKTTTTRQDERVLVSIVVVAVVLVFGAYYLIAKSREIERERCATQGGTVVTTPEGRVCARIEIVK